MNKQRRKEIEKACMQFVVLENKVGEYKERLEDLKSKFETLRDEEQEYVDNMPESLHNSDKYTTALDCVERIEKLIDGLGTLIEAIDEMPNSDDVLEIL